MRETKDSNIKWVGVIPSTWTTELGKHFMTCLDRPVREDDGVITCFRDGEVTLRSKRREDGFTVSFQEIGYQGIEPGDLVVHGMDGFAGAIGISDSRGKATPVLNVLDTEQDKRYMMYALRNMAYTDVFLALSTGIRVRSCDTSWKKLRSLQYALPPLDEQSKIADRIEQKSKQVDALIANQQAQIEKLKQYKQSLITEVVTKGLDPNAPMKDSGVEWIGKIANGHQIYRLKFLLTAPMMYGANESGSKETENSVRYIRITDITTDSKLKDDENNLYLSLDVAKDYLLVDGDVLFARSGGTVGKSFIYRSEYGESAFAGYLIKAECNTEKLLPEYLFYYTLSSLYEQWKNMIFIQATIQNIGANKYSNMEIVVPSIQEQKHIVEFLARKCRKIDRLIDIKNRKIEKLNDYKKSLIYEYVTGKKEVV